MKKSAVTVVLFVTLGNLFGQVDSTLVRPKRNLLQKSIVPLSLIASGMLLSDSGLEKSLNADTRNWVGQDFNLPADDYTRYAPIVQLYIADIVGIEAKSHWFDQTKNMAISMLLTDAVTKLMKKSIYKVRPNGTNSDAFPSGHTSVAFATGSVLYEEFKETSPILAYSGYGFSAATGVFRLLNNKHWVSDVIMGAGLGIMITKLVYHFDYLFQWNPFLTSKDMVLIPRYSQGTAGLYFSKKF